LVILVGLKLSFNPACLEERRLAEDPGVMIGIACGVVDPTGR
jgi:hypothetical protein